MPLEDGAGLRQAAAASIFLQMLWGPDDPIDLTTPVRTVTVACLLNGVALGGVAVTTTTKVSMSGEAAGALGWVQVDFSAANLNAAGTLTIEPSTSGTPTVNAPEKPVRIPIRAAHADAA